MNNRILFCVETTQQANTDYPYIRDTIDYYYEVPRKTVIRPIYLGSKTRYNSRSVRENIKKQSGTSGNTHVIYCIDTDSRSISEDNNHLTERIREYCNKQGYDFIFFCRDVEDVYHGRQLPDTEKVQAVRRFRSRRLIETIKSENLKSKEYRYHCSNILNVLDQYLPRKKKRIGGN